MSRWRKKQVVVEAWQSLPPEERQRTEILAGNYGEAAALAYFGGPRGLPRVSSGHMTYFLWGPTNPGADTVLAVGVRPEWLWQRCERLEQRAVADHPLATPGERRVPVMLCRGLARPIGELWPELKSYDNSIRRSLGTSPLARGGEGR